jgi:hypothetical protein
MHGMEPHDEIEYWRKRAERAEVLAQLHTDPESVHHNKLLAESLIENRRLSALLAEMDAGLAAMTAWRNRLAAQIDSANQHTVKIEQQLAERDAEVGRLRELLVEAVGAFDDWPECDDKAQHTNVIVEIERALWTPSDETLAPFRAATKAGAHE